MTIFSAGRTHDRRRTCNAAIGGTYFRPQPSIYLNGRTSMLPPCLGELVLPVNYNNPAGCGRKQMRVISLKIHSRSKTPICQRPSLSIHGKLTRAAHQSRVSPSRRINNSNPPLSSRARAREKLHYVSLRL